MIEKTKRKSGSSFSLKKKKKEKKKLSFHKADGEKHHGDAQMILKKVPHVATYNISTLIVR